MTIEDKTIRVQKTSIESHGAESDIIHKINKQTFYTIMKSFDVDLKSVFEDGRINSKNAISFNRMVTHIISKNILEISEVVLIIEHDHAPFKRILSVLNQENLQLLTEQLADKHGIKIKKNKLKGFLYQ